MDVILMPYKTYEKPLNIELEKMTLDEFKKRYMSGVKVFDFSKFEITCKSCGSRDVEFGGVSQEDSSGCYYPGDNPDFTMFFVCKCH